MAPRQFLIAEIDVVTQMYVVPKKPAFWTVHLPDYVVAAATIMSYCQRSRRNSSVCNGVRSIGKIRENEIVSVTVKKMTIEHLCRAIEILFYLSYWSQHLHVPFNPALSFALPTCSLPNEQLPDPSWTLQKVLKFWLLLPIYVSEKRSLTERLKQGGGGRFLIQQRSRAGVSARDLTYLSEPE